MQDLESFQRSVAVSGLCERGASRCICSAGEWLAVPFRK